jgi:hypothetical protein
LSASRSRNAFEISGRKELRRSVYPSGIAATKNPPFSFEQQMT